MQKLSPKTKGTLKALRRIDDATSGIGFTTIGIAAIRGFGLLAPATLPPIGAAALTIGAFATGGYFIYQGAKNIYRAIKS